MSGSGVASRDRVKLTVVCVLSCDRFPFFPFSGDVYLFLLSVSVRFEEL